MRTDDLAWAVLLIGGTAGAVALLASQRPVSCLTPCASPSPRCGCGGRCPPLTVDIGPPYGCVCADTTGIFSSSQGGVCGSSDCCGFPGCPCMKRDDLGFLPWNRQVQGPAPRY